MSNRAITRREILAGPALAGAALAASRTPPTAPVAIARCRNYTENLEATLARMFDQVGGLGAVVKNRTVALKLNLTGNPRRFAVDPLLPYRTEPNTVLAVAHLMARAGARRIRIIESFFPAGQDMALWARYGLDIHAINNAGCKVEWENVQNLGHARRYTRMKVPWGGYVFPAYDLNHSFADCDAFVSMSKLKHHWIAGVTMALKNSFGNTPCSLYGGDAGESGNENPASERGAVCHLGKSAPPKRSEERRGG